VDAALGGVLSGSDGADIAFLPCAGHGGMTNAEGSASEVVAPSTLQRFADTGNGAPELLRPA
jgi:hypothetical protein